MKRFFVKFEKLELKVSYYEFSQKKAILNRSFSFLGKPKISYLKKARSKKCHDQILTCFFPWLTGRSSAVFKLVLLSDIRTCTLRRNWFRSMDWERNGQFERLIDRWGRSGNIVDFLNRLILCERSEQSFLILGKSVKLHNSWDEKICSVRNSVR